MDERNNIFEIDVKELIYLLIRRWWIIIAVGILSAACAGLISQYLITPLYKSTTQIYVINRQDEKRTTYTDLQTGTQLTKDYMFMVTSRPVLEGVIESLEVDLSNKELADLISVRNPDGTRILEISVVYKDPYLAKQLADMVAKVSSEHLISIMEMEKVNIVEDGNLPTYPFSPNISRNVIFGAFAGLAIACLVIVFIHIMNDNIKNADDIEKYLGLTTLGIIPRDVDIRKKKTQIPKKIFHKEEWAS